MDSAKSQLIDRLKTASSILVTVSKDPSVDQLAACIGLTLLINKLDKHGSAVFSGKIPSTIEFLKPEQTLEKTADSLRDFIIALDKNKADKLRYKVEDQMVRIFITPYKTSLSEDDLEFSQGDYNVDLIIALGVKKQEDLDQAIVAHGRILHDATVACLNTGEPSNLGSINWQDQTASSLCELVTDLADNLGDKLLDEQIATALLTGIIAETDRFSNQKTTSQTMSIGGKLMAAGANQQLVATNLSEPLVDNTPTKDKADDKPKDSSDDGALNIEHDEEDLDVTTLPSPSHENDDKPIEKFVTEPPSRGGELTANTEPEQYDPSTDPLSKTTTFTPPPPAWQPPAAPEPAAKDAPSSKTDDDQTLTELEKAVHSPHLKEEKEADNNVDDARDNVEAVLAESPDSTPTADQSLNAMPLGEPLHEDDKKPEAGNTGLDPSLFSEVPSKNADSAGNGQAPPVPPPIYPIDQPPENSSPAN